MYRDLFPGVEIYEGYFHPPFGVGFKEKQEKTYPERFLRKGCHPCATASVGV